MLGSLSENDRILVLSPHLDDAVLSAGGLIDLATKHGCSVIVGNLFTADSSFVGEPSPLVKELHEWWGLGSNPYETRRNEDVAALTLLGAEVIQGGLLDSIYRTDEAGLPLYPTREAVFSSPSMDDPAWNDAKELISSWISSVRPSLVLCPMAVGRHVDHSITTEAFRHESTQWDVEVYLYEDIPYSAGFFPPNFPDGVPAARSRSAWKPEEYVDIFVDFSMKFSAVRKYASQIAEIFPGLDAEEELRRYMSFGEQGTYRERYWKARKMS